MLVLKGIIIGIGKIIPGLSGSMLAISLGIYQKLINSINNFFKDIKSNIKFLTSIAIGVILSIAFLSNIILKCLNNYYIVTMFFFIGLIIGSMGDIKNNINKNHNYIALILLIIVTVLGLVTIDNDVAINNVLLSIIYFAFIGFIDAVTTVVPGISGTATLMMLGAYNTLIKSFSTLFDIDYLVYNFKILIPFVFGFVIGVIITARIIGYMFKNYKSKTYSAILGFSLSTIFLMFIKCFKASYNLNNLIIGTVLLFIGIFITKKLIIY